MAGLKADFMMLHSEIHGMQELLAVALYQLDVDAWVTELLPDNANGSHKELMTKINFLQNNSRLQLVVNRPYTVETTKVPGGLSAIITMKPGFTLPDINRNELADFSNFKFRYSATHFSHILKFDLQKTVVTQNSITFVFQIFDNR